MKLVEGVYHATFLTEDIDQLVTFYERTRRLLALLALVAAAVYVGVRAARSDPAGGLEADPARALLDRRLAAGEIDPEDYYEREAVLRTSPSSSRRAAIAGAAGVAVALAAGPLGTPRRSSPGRSLQ